jgi:hypothetical protein
MNYYYFKFKKYPENCKYIGYLGTLKQISKALNVSEYKLKKFFDTSNEDYERSSISSQDVPKVIREELKDNIILISNDDYIEEVEEI